MRKHTQACIHKETEITNEKASCSSAHIVSCYPLGGWKSQCWSMTELWTTYNHKVTLGHCVTLANSHRLGSKRHPLDLLQTRSLKSRDRPKSWHQCSASTEPFIHSFNKHLLNVFYTLWGSGVAGGSRKSSSLHLSKSLTSLPQCPMAHRFTILIFVCVFLCITSSPPLSQDTTH